MADPENLAGDPRRDPVPGGIPFTKVRNNWDGFVGRERYAFIDGVPDPTIPLDLNNNGVIDESVADVYPDANPDTKDANGDLDGWRNFQGLPWTSHVRKSLAYLEDRSLYAEFQDDDTPRRHKRWHRRDHR